MKKLSAALTITAFAIVVPTAFALTAPKPPAPNCAAQSGSSLTINGNMTASSSVETHKLMGGLSHGTERSSASTSTASSPGWTKGGGASVGKTASSADCAQSAVSGSLPVEGAASSSSSSSSASTTAVQKIKTKSNIKND